MGLCLGLRAGRRGCEGSGVGLGLGRRVGSVAWGPPRLKAKNVEAEAAARARSSGSSCRATPQAMRRGGGWNGSLLF